MFGSVIILSQRKGTLVLNYIWSRADISIVKETAVSIEVLTAEHTQLKFNENQVIKK